MAAPSFVYTIAYAAKLLGEDEKWLEELVDQLELEDGRPWIYEADDRGTLGFTERGVEYLKELSLER